MCQICAHSSLVYVLDDKGETPTFQAVDATQPGAVAAALHPDGEGINERDFSAESVGAVEGIGFVAVDPAEIIADNVGALGDRDALAQGVPDSVDPVLLISETPGFLANSFSVARATVTVEEGDLDVAADISTTAVLQEGQIFAGEIGPFGNDVDGIRVSLEVGQTYQFDVLGLISDAGTLVDTSIRAVLDADGNEISGVLATGGGRSQPAGDEAQLFFTPDESGVFTILVGSDVGTNQIGTYEVAFQNLGADVSADTDTTLAIGVDDTLTGTLNTTTDEDWIAVDLQAGRTYTIELLGEQNSRGTIRRPEITGVFDSDGGLVLAGTTGTSGRTSARLTFEVTETGTYFVGAASSFAEQGTYVLSVRDNGLTPGEDIPDDISTTAVAEVDVPFVSRIDTDGPGSDDTEDDWVRIDLEAGVTYQIDMLGGPRSITGEQAPVDLNLTDARIVAILDQNGDPVSLSAEEQDLLDNSDDGAAGTDSRTLFTPAETGTYIFVLSAFDNTAAGGVEIDDVTTDGGFYQLLVTERLPDVSSTDDFADVPNNTTPLIADDTLAGAINRPGDVDVIPVTVSAGDTIRISVLAGDGQTVALDNPFLQMLDADGEPIPLAFNDNVDSYNAVLEFTPGFTGTAFIQVTSSTGMGRADGPGGREEEDTGSYTIAVEDVADRSADDPAYSPFNVADALAIETNQFTGNDQIDAFFEVRQSSNGLLTGLAYEENADGSPLILPFSFNTADSQLVDSYAGDRDSIFLYEFNDVQQAMAVDATAQLESFLNVDFVEVEDTGNDLNSGIYRFAWSSEERDNVVGFAFLPISTSPEVSDVFVISENQPEDDFAGSFLHLTILHELGHAMGLAHPFNDDNDPLDDNNFLPDTQANVFLTVMTNNADLPDGTQLSFLDLYPQTYMYLDILALQSLYDTQATRVGDDIYSFDGDTRYFLTLWDNGGTDTISITNSADNLSIDLTPDSWIGVGTTINGFQGGTLAAQITESVYIPPEVTIENAFSDAGNDTLTGNMAQNLLAAGSGDDLLTGISAVDGTGDTLAGEAGSDTLLGSAGNDILLSGVGDDTLSGGDGHDLLFGGSDNGQDTITGGAGDDTIFAGGGNDNISAGDGDDVVRGGDGNDSLIGGAGNDILISGAGDDTLIGGAGSDLYIIGVGSNEIRGFDAGDTLDIALFGFASAEAVFAAASETGRGTLIDLGNGNSILLDGVSISQLEQLNLFL